MLKRHNVIRAVLAYAEEKGAIVHAVDTTKGLVLCELPAGDWVTWKYGYVSEEDRAFFHWGNYRPHKADAVVDFATR